jgi:hypothetical protein
MATVSSVQEALRYTYGVNKVLYLFNEESVTWACHSSNKKQLGGRGQFIMPLWVKNPGAFTGIVEGGSLPSALQPDTTEATFGLQEYVATYDVTWKLIQDARTDKFAFERAIQMLDSGLKRRIFRNLNSDLIGTGKGELGVLPAADNQVTVTLNTPFRGEVGMVVDVMDLSDDDTKLADSVTVTAVLPLTNEVTLSGAPAGTAAGDYIVIQDTTDASLNGGVALHTDGLMGVISDANPATIVGNFGNINRSTAGNEFWQAAVLSNSGVNRPFTEDLGIQAQDSVRLKGGGVLDRWLTNLPITRRYHEMLRAETFATYSSPQAIGGGLGRKGGKAPENGKTPYEFSGIAWHVDPYFYANTIIGQDSSAFYLGVGENEVPRPISEIFDNIPFFRQTTSATFEVAWYYQMQLLSDNPAAGVKISDVAES